MSPEIKRMVQIAAILFFLIGLGLFSWPWIFSYLFEKRVEQEIEAFSIPFSEKEKDESSGEIPEDASKETKALLQELYEAMKQYNQDLFLSGQSGLVDQLSYEEPDFHPSAYGVDSDILGVIRIERLDIELPIYNGASEKNMALGATYLAHTSLPIGGENTNTVIAAHTRYKGVEMFKNITLLEPGDDIYIKNYWGILHYKVSETAVIVPDDIGKIYIQPGRDLLTLSTCHPFPDNYQRYLVYAERIV